MRDLDVNVADRLIHPISTSSLTLKSSPQPLATSTTWKSADGKGKIAINQSRCQHGCHMWSTRVVVQRGELNPYTMSRWIPSLHIHSIHARCPALHNM